MGACVTEAFQKARVILSSGGEVLFETIADILPGAPFVAGLNVAAATDSLTLRVLTGDGIELITWTRQDIARPEHIPAPAKEPPSPDDVQTVEELYITGLHLEQYRHATRSPEPYWEEALRRDPFDSRCNTSLGKLLLRRGLFSKAEEHFCRAIQRLTARNPNPATGEPHYYLGLSLLFEDRDAEATRPSTRQPGITNGDRPLISVSPVWMPARSNGQRPSNISTGHRHQP